MLHVRIALQMQGMLSVLDGNPGPQIAPGQAFCGGRFRGLWGELLIQTNYKGGNFTIGWLLLTFGPYLGNVQAFFGRRFRGLWGESPSQADRRSATFRVGDASQLGFDELRHILRVC
jgi:hypothetical protein